MLSFATLHNFWDESNVIKSAVMTEQCELVNFSLYIGGIGGDQEVFEGKASHYDIQK